MNKTVFALVRAGLMAALALFTALMPGVLYADDSGGGELDTSLMDMSIEDLLDISVVTATRKSQKLTEAPAVIAVITEGQIRERGYTSVAEALGSLPGLFPLFDRYQYNLGVRGINGGMRASSRIVKVMIDGQPVAFRSSGENWLGPELIPIRAVKSIEVIRGPSSALYGANAFLGVVNIITKSGADLGGLELTASLGSASENGSWRAGMLYGAVDGARELLFAIDGGMSELSGARALDMPKSQKYANAGETENEKSRPLSIFAKAGGTSEQGASYTFDLSYQRMDAYAEFADWAVLTHENRISLYNFTLRGAYERELGDTLGARFTAAYFRGGPTNQERLSVDQRGLGDWITRSLGYSGLDVAAEFSKSFGETDSLTFGVDYTTDEETPQTYYRHNEGQEPRPTGQVLQKKTFSNTGAYVQGIMHPARYLKSGALKPLALTLGLRYDMHNIYEDVLNWRAGGVYDITERVHIKALYGTSFKAPASVQLYSTPLYPGGVVGNPGLKAEKARTFELALGALLSESLSVSANAFYTIVEDKVELTESAVTSNTESANVAEIDSWGSELDVNYKKGDFGMYLNYSHQKSEMEKEDRLRGTLTVDTRLYPTHMLKGGVNISLPKHHLRVNVEGRYASEVIASDQNIKNHDPLDLKRYELGSFLVVDVHVLRGEIKLFGGSAELGLKIRNLFDESYAYPGFRDYDVPGTGRSFWLTLTQRF